MGKVLRARRLWAGLVVTAAAVALLVTVEPVRLAVHEVLNGLREQPMAIEPIVEGTAAAATPAATTDLPPDTFVITEVEAPIYLDLGATEPLPELQFQPITLDAPAGFDAAAERTVQQGGSWRVDVDFEQLQRFLAGSQVRVPLPERLRTRAVTIQGPEILVTTWTSTAPSSDDLVLVQFAAPRVSAPPEVDLELISQALVREFLPPVLARQIVLREIALYRDILGLRPLEDDGQPQTLQLPDGRALVHWRADDSYAVLMGPGSPKALLRLAGLEPGA
ncbi:MAG: hypothetical protein OXU21_13135 [Chloroflexota bacterium]|nr:hypothetical protein [Chloroflexota bacterium]